MQSIFQMLEKESLNVREEYRQLLGTHNPSNHSNG
ncbi:hypothetical protein SLEP1_g19037 [Rubroshorea leprosula]|nr:hypothetical protein SLEP1_g19037 [Rubroshorea leprosula]